MKTEKLEGRASFLSSEPPSKTIQATLTDRSQGGALRHQTCEWRSHHKNAGQWGF